MIVKVALPLPIDRTFSYLVPDIWVPIAQHLSRVKVPFNNRSLTGFIVAIDNTEEGGDLKPIQEVLDPVPLVDKVCFRLCAWSATYYVAPIGLALKYALPSAIRIDKYCVIETNNPTASALNGMPLKKASAAIGKELVFDCLYHATIRLCDVFTNSPIEVERTRRQGDGYRPEAYVGSVQDRLDYYISRVSAQLEQDRNVLMLLPDRHDVGDFFYRALAKRFPGVVFWYGSSASEKKKAEAYFRGRNRKGQLILGNKSCVFLPLVDLGLVIVERPEEDEYRNEDTFRFNAAHVAMKRAELESVPVILGSISPPVEIMKLAEEGVARVSRGPSAKTPEVSYARNEKGKGLGVGLPEEIVTAIREALDDGGNVVVHTPRRAYAANLNCSVCGQSLACVHCGGFAISYNREGDNLTCSICKNNLHYAEACPACHSPFIRFFEAGAEFLETRLCEEFPSVPLIKVTGESDKRLRGSFRSDASLRREMIVVGTHVLSKLYGFKADLLVLYGWDDFLRSGGYRGREKLFQVLANLLDALKPERLLVCTSARESLDLSLFLDPTQFYQDELIKRRIADFPPYERFFLINVLKRSKSAGARTLGAIEKLVAGENLEHQMLGPIEVKGQYSWRIVLKGHGEALFPLLSSLYRLTGVHVEADPLYV
jgi:primosomal protein N' (replication factor Y) (superfamily II helicase)